MSQAVITLVGIAPLQYLEEVMQGFRDVEQKHPDEIHFKIHIAAEYLTTEQAEALLKSVTPGFPFTVTTAGRS